MAEKTSKPLIQVDAEKMIQQQERERQISEINHETRLEREYREYQRKNNLDYYEDYLPTGMEPYKWGH